MDIDDAKRRLPLLEGIRVLGEDEALALAGTVPVGRVVYSRYALPAVHVVNFTLDGRDVIFRSRRGAKFGAAIADTVVAFETDHVDEATHGGWTVTLTGRARLVTAVAELERLATLDACPWAAGDRDYCVRINTKIITGRRIGSA